MLFDDQRTHRVSLPDVYSPAQVSAFPRLSDPVEEEKKPTDVHYLIHWLRHFLLGQGQNPDLFMQGDSVYVFFFGIWT